MKNYKFFILTILAIVLLGLNTYRKIQDLQNPLPPISLPKFEDIQLQPIVQQNNQKKKEFVSPDKKLGFKYGSDWTEIDSQYLQKIPAQLNQENNENDTKILFLAQKIIPDSNVFVQLVVSEINWKIENGLEEVIQKIKTNIESGWKMEVLKSDITENKAYFEAIYQHESSPQLYSKEKILFDRQQKYFLIEFFTLEQDWKSFEQEISEIFESVKIEF